MEHHKVTIKKIHLYTFVLAYIPFSTTVSLKSFHHLFYITHGYLIFMTKPFFNNKEQTHAYFTKDGKAHILKYP